jgi:hypothetical protein
VLIDELDPEVGHRLCERNSDADQVLAVGACLRDAEACADGLVLL